MNEAEEEADEDLQKIETASGRSLLCRSQWDPEFFSNSSNYLRQWLQWFSHLIHDIEELVPRKSQEKFLNVAIPITLQTRQAIRNCYYDERRQQLRAENIANLSMRPDDVSQNAIDNAELLRCHQKLLSYLGELYEITKCPIPTKNNIACRTEPEINLRNISRSIRREVLEQIEADVRLYDDYMEFMEFDDKCTVFVNNVIEYKEAIVTDYESISNLMKANKNEFQVTLSIDNIWRGQLKRFQDLIALANDIDVPESTMSAQINERIKPLLAKLLPNFPWKLTREHVRNKRHLYRFNSSTDYHLRRQLFLELYMLHQRFVENQLHNQQDELPEFMDWEMFIRSFVTFEYYIIGLKSMYSMIFDSSTDL